MHVIRINCINMNPVYMLCSFFLSLSIPRLTNWVLIIKNKGERNSTRLQSMALDAVDSSQLHKKESDNAFSQYNIKILVHLLMSHYCHFSFECCIFYKFTDCFSLLNGVWCNYCCIKYKIDNYFHKWANSCIAWTKNLSTMVVIDKMVSEKQCKLLTS